MKPERGIYPAGLSAYARRLGVVRRSQHRAFLRTKVRAPTRFMVSMRVHPLEVEATQERTNRRTS
jgi:hypothetical protein